MNKWLAAMGLALLLALLATAVVLAAPELTVIHSQVTILSDGKLDVKYRLSFLENEPRDKITTIGPFDPTHQIVAATLDGPGGSSPVNLVSKGSDQYTANFAVTTDPGETYTVTVHYRVERALDTTSIGGADYRVVSWAPVQWALPIGEQIVTFITPIELPADITRPEQVTQEVVQAAGLVEDAANKASFDRWVYYATPDATTGKNYLSVYVSRRNLAPQDHVLAKFYLPARYFAQLPPTQVPGTPVVAPTPAPTPPPNVAPFVLLGLGGLFLGLGGVLAAVVGGIMFRAARPRSEPVVYQPPEIEIETFEQPGLVPDLDAVEAALYVGNSAKAIALIVLALVQRGVLNIVNRDPLQLEVLSSATQGLADYEQALVDGIAEDGTIPSEVQSQVIKLVSAHLSTKLWNADPQATRQTYQQRAQDAWTEYEQAEPDQRPQVWEQQYPWITLWPEYRPLPETGGAPAPVPRPVGEGPAPALSPILVGADQMAGVLEGLGHQVARQME
ncbi:MAG: DUF2207 domain-containing protein, partial [Chloroflexi bacterium]|nr:DUF2207 domain-containing protein [Chloroflexota bacterium]